MRQGLLFLSIFLTSSSVIANKVRYAGTTGYINYPNQYRTSQYVQTPVSTYTVGREPRVQVAVPAYTGVNPSIIAPRPLEVVRTRGPTIVQPVATVDVVERPVSYVPINSTYSINQAWQQEPASYRSPAHPDWHRRWPSPPMLARVQGTADYNPSEEGPFIHLQSHIDGHGTYPFISQEVYYDKNKKNDDHSNNDHHLPLEPSVINIDAAVASSESKDDTKPVKPQDTQLFGVKIEGESVDLIDDKKIYSELKGEAAAMSYQMHGSK